MADYADLNRQTKANLKQVCSLLSNPNIEADHRRKGANEDLTIRRDLVRRKLLWPQRPHRSSRKTV
jgi:hypothetical protein